MMEGKYGRFVGRSVDVGVQDEEGRSCQVRGTRDVTTDASKPIAKFLEHVRNVRVQRMR
jgi:hypothetical protein